jgi:uncharacterized membrane protein YjgN (DUF898 family)
MTPSVCSACGTKLPDDVRFCPSCGQFIADSAAAPASAPAPQPATPREVTPRFRGRASEYFGIWIVNVLLSIVTIGIYSAWAKVRRLRYFYGNTELDGHTFDYHAAPIQILKGRLLVVAVLVVYQALVAISPFFSVLALVYVFGLPWAINTSLAFNARMTSYRNVRFSFRGSYWPAFGIFVAFPILIFLSLGLLLPVFSRLAGNYVGNRLRFGGAPFRTQLMLKPLYANLGWTVLAMIGFVVLLSLGSVAVGSASRGLGGGLSVWHVVVLVSLYGSFFLAAPFYRAGVRNALFQATRLEPGHQLVSRLNRGKVVWIAVSNVIVTVLTLGLMRPWAAIRSWNYTIASSALIAQGSLDGIVAAAGAEGSVVGAEYVDIGGIDLGV